MYLKKNEYIYFPPISDGKLTIRELNYDDVNCIFELFKNPNVTKYLAFNEYKNKEDAKNLITRTIDQYKNKNIFYLGIVENQTNKVVGYIGLSRYDLTETTCQIVYALNELYWGKGLMTNAVKLFIDYLFNDLKKEKIIATHIDINEGSGRVMEKAGMKRDKMHDQVMIIKGKEENLIGYSITKE